MDLKTRKRLVRRGRWTVTTGVALVALGLLSFNASATFGGTSSVTHDVNSGTLTLALGATGSVTNRMNIPSVDIAPGDTMQRTLTITAGGTVSMSDIALTLTAPTSSLLDTNAVSGLQILIERCTVQWTEAGPPYTYTCSGATSTMLASTSVSALKALGATSLSNDVLSGANYVRITLSFPSGANDTYQNLTTQLSFSWAGAQRAGTDK